MTSNLPGILKWAWLGMSMLLLAATASAQNSVQIRIFSDPAEATFLVDNVQYRGSQTFLWPVGSKHTLEAPLTDGSGGTTRWTFAGWKDNAGQLAIGSERFQVVTANTGISSIQVTYTKQHRLDLVFYEAPTLGSDLTGTDCAIATASTQNTPGLRPGVVYMSGECYTASGSTWVAEGTEVQLNAFPYRGYVFLGWNINGAAPGDAYLRTLTISGPTVIQPRFSPATRVLFYTEPELLQVYVDRSAIPTMLRTDPVDDRNTGLVDLIPGSQHVLGAPTPQQHPFTGKYWVFDSFDIGGGQNLVYTAATTNSIARITARFVPAATVSLLTQPLGLPLVVNGRNNWPSYNFVWAVGSKNTVTAPAEVTDAKGRRYRFVSWSNGGAATQEITTPADTDLGGFRLIANYELLPRLTISSAQAGAQVNVDGVPCPLPCSVDRVSGSTAKIEAPERIALGSDSRAEFVAWSDASGTARTITFAGDEKKLVVNYRVMNALLARSDPADGATFTLEPASADGFYAASDAVRITAKAKEGYKFRRWSGDLEGTSATGTVSMAVPRAVTANLDKVPTISEAGIRNAAGETPDPVVGPGGILTIYGSQLAPELAIGPSVPLVQTLANTTVRWGDRLLPLLFVSPEQINALLPSDVPEGEQKLFVRTGNQTEIPGKMVVARNAPGLFCSYIEGVFFVVALHEDGSAVTSASPARRNETVTILGTGFGPYERPMADGFGAPATPPNKLADAVSLHLGDQVLTPSAFATPGQVGLVSLQFTIPAEVASGSQVPVEAVVNGRRSNAAVMAVE